MIGKLFAGNKPNQLGQNVKKSKNGFFLELDENQDTQAVSSEPVAAKAVEQKQPESANGKVVESKQPESANGKVVESKQPESANGKAVESKKSKVASKTKKTAKKTSVKATPASPQVPTWEPPAWVKAMENTKTKIKQEENGESKPEMTFATQYLMPTPNKSRRRPGGSLSMYMDMARQVKR